jgi:hypothetical protein
MQYLGDIESYDIRRLPIQLQAPNRTTAEHLTHPHKRSKMLSLKMDGETLIRVLVAVIHVTRLPDKQLSAEGPK